jgi:hypothetical protein
MVCSRINSLLELDKNTNKSKPMGSDFENANGNLKKIDSHKRPRTRNTLTKHIKTALNIDKDTDVQTIIDLLFIQGIVCEEGGRIRYTV